MKKSTFRGTPVVKSFLDLPKRFLDKTKKMENGCIFWTAFRDGNGYGKFGIGRKVFLAHRVTYEQLIGNVGAGLELDHLCRNRACVNPFHLEPVSHKTNCQRGLAGHKERIKTHCPQNHEYTEENIYWYNNHRYCRKCHYNYSKKYRLKHRRIF